MHAAVGGVSHVSGCREADADLDVDMTCLGPRRAESERVDGEWSIY